MKSISKKILASILSVILFVMVLGTNIYAEDITKNGTGLVVGSVAINGSISPVMISVTHPLTASYNIDPNGGEAGSFTAPEISIQNNSRVAVNVAVRLTSAPGAGLNFTDVDPASRDWKTLNKVDSSKYIAMGITADPVSAWDAGFNSGTHWSYQTTATPVGTLKPAAIGKFSLNARYGLAFDGLFKSTHSLEFIVSLA